MNKYQNLSADEAYKIFEDQLVETLHGEELSQLTDTLVRRMMHIPEDQAKDQDENDAYWAEYTMVQQHMLAKFIATRFSLDNALRRSGH